MRSSCERDAPRRPSEQLAGAEAPSSHPATPRRTPPADQLPPGSSMVCKGESRWCWRGVDAALMRGGEHEEHRRRGGARRRGALVSRRCSMLKQSVAKNVEFAGVSSKDPDPARITPQRCREVGLCSENFTSCCNAVRTDGERAAILLAGGHRTPEP